MRSGLRRSRSGPHIEMPTVVDAQNDQEVTVAMTDAGSALRRFRAIRRTTTRRQADPFDRFYRVYVTGLIAMFGFYTSLGLVDEATVDRAGIEWVQDRGPLWFSLVAALAIAAGARSGANGGPLTIDDVELHHVLLSPIDRATVLAHPTRRLLGGATGVSAVIGAACGELASRQLPGDQTSWILAGCLTGAAMAVASVGSALVASGSNRRHRVAATVAFLIPVWAVVDLVTGTTTAPTSGFGTLALWPLDQSPLAASALVIAACLTLWGWSRMATVSLERVHHRSQLARQIRFAMAQQDIRSLLLLRRQLGFETPRQRPWATIPFGTRLENRFPVALRDIRSYLRWPARRIARVGALSVVAGLALSATWHGTTALIVVVGSALYVAAIEVVEPLGQELDHPGMVELIPVIPGAVNLAHVASAAAAMTILWLLAGGVAAVAALDWHLALAAGIAAIPASAAAVAAAALSIKRFDSPAVVPNPEVEGPRLLIRLLWPPALTLAGALPILIAREARTEGSSMGPSTLNGSLIVALVAALTIIWIRFRDEITAAATQPQGGR